MSERYIKLFKEEDETFDISLCDSGLKIVKDLLVDSLNNEFDRNTTRERLFELQNLLTQLKNNEVQEQSSEEEPSYIQRKRRPDSISNRELSNRRRPRPNIDD